MFLSDFTLIGTYAIFLTSYLVFALGKFPGMKIDRPGMAIIGAVLMFAFGALHPSGNPSKPELLDSILFFFIRSFPHSKYSKDRIARFSDRHYKAPNEFSGGNRD